METSVITSDRQVAETVVSEPQMLPASSLETITRSEIDAQIVTARRYPRSLALFKSTACSMIDTLVHVGRHPAASKRKALRISCPRSVCATSGWNCTA